MGDLEETLRRLTLHDDAFIEEALGGTSSTSSPGLDPKTLSFARLAALIAMGGPLPAYISRVEAAMLLGATCDEIVGVLLGVAQDVGESRSVAAASGICGALGMDTVPI
jgi:alkylhydroperoxidase/carboxymuconolactone decarboxylase family protein YurZ